jgi:lipopolysaccharide/colanic/teichoic acid biosynthesis glycosyltransferase
VSDRDLDTLVESRSGTTCALGCVVAADEVPALLEQLDAHPSLKLSVLWVMDGGPAMPAVQLPGGGDVRLCERLDDLVDGCADVDVIVVSERYDLMVRDTAFAVIELALHSVPLRRLSELLASPATITRTARHDLELVKAVIGTVDATSRGRRVKRVLDAVLALVGLVFVAPLLVLIAAAVRLDSPGNPFLVQERLGRRREPFRCLKFRTMYKDAERLTGPVWTTPDDKRITRVGRFLRKSRLDELPQLWNVLRGDMSIVGARPIRKHFADQIADILPFYDLRFVEKPGLTGWAQVKFKYSASIEEQITKFFYDFYYIRHRNIMLDFYIMWLTVWEMMRMRGA